jgi:adenylate cyclase
MSPCTNFGPLLTMSEEAALKHRLAAVMASDIVGYSRGMQLDEAATLSALAEMRDVATTQINRHQGRVANTAGDSIIAAFASAVDALSCAMVLQELLHQRAVGKGELKIRIGIHIGDIVEKNGDVFGTAVNVAARLEGLAPPGGIVVSAAVRADIAGKLPASFTDLGVKVLKNIAEPIGAFSITPLIGSSPAAIHNADQHIKLPHQARISVAVLPFANMSSDPEQEFLADGLTEDLITELSHLRDFMVIARNTVFTYKGRAVDISQVGRELGVRYLLEGSVRRLGNRLRITAQLIETETGSHLWAEKFDRDIAGLFEIQDEVVKAVAASTQTRLVINEGEIAERSTADMDMWAFTSRGWKEIYRLTPESLKKAEEIGRELVQRDPSSAKGRHILASALYHLVIMGNRAGTPELKAEIAREAREAVRLDPQDEYAVWVYGSILLELFNRPTEGVAHLQHALRINPNFSLAYGTLGSAYVYMGRPDEGIEQIEIAIRLNPRDPSVFFRYAALAEANFVKHDHEQTLHWANQAIALKPDYWYSHAVAAATLALNGDIESAKVAASYLGTCLQETTITFIKATAFYSETFWARLEEGLIAAGVSR